MSQALEKPLSMDDMQAVIKLLGKVAAPELNFNQKRITLIRGLCELTQADAWVWGVPGSMKEGNHTTFSITHHEGFTDAQFAAYLEVLEKPKMATMFTPIQQEYAACEGTLTRRRDQFDPEEKIYTEEYSEWRDKIDLAPLIISLTPVPSGHTSCAALYRRYSSPIFTPRDSKIAHLIFSEIQWLHDELTQKPPVDDVNLISPRINTILNLLLRGNDRKEIAHKLDISDNTDSKQNRDIYGHFKVHSQVELIRRFSLGDGGDTPN
jgi:DNA-binding CsgD family transcriptional regulator